MSKNDRGFLLASFLTGVDDQGILDEVNYIVENLDLTNQFIFLFQLTEDPLKKVLTYNILPAKGKPFNSRLFTMRIHRKKQTNTLYTINALNAAVASQHDGATGKNLKLDWEPFANSILLTEGKKLQTHPVEVVKIFKIEDPPEEN